MTFQTEYPFELPRGFVDNSGNLHKRGLMRLATAADEILPLKDPRVQQNAAYITIILLTRVIVKLGDLISVDTRVVENMFASDLNYLQDFYQRINNMESPAYQLDCPHCHTKFELPVSFFGEAQ